LFNVPNILTMIRLVLVVVFYFVFNIPDHMLALAIFLVAGATDLLDGYIARKYDLVTDLGKLLDPLADKLLLIVALFCLYSAGYVPLVFPILATIKEVAMVVGGALLLTREHKVVYSKTIGKIAAGTFFLGVAASFFKPQIDPYHIVVLIVGLGLSVVAMVSYAAENIFRRKTEE